jgi:hypothetical protein
LKLRMGRSFYKLEIKYRMRCMRYSMCRGIPTLSSYSFLWLEIVSVPKIKSHMNGEQVYYQS